MKEPTNKIRWINVCQESPLVPGSPTCRTVFARDRLVSQRRHLTTHPSDASERAGNARRQTQLHPSKTPADPLPTMVARPQERASDRSSKEKTSNGRKPQRCVVGIAPTRNSTDLAQYSTREPRHSTLDTTKRGLVTKGSECIQPTKRARYSSRRQIAHKSRLCRRFREQKMFPFRPSRFPLPSPPLFAHM